MSDRHTLPRLVVSGCCPLMLSLIFVGSHTSPRAGEPVQPTVLVAHDSLDRDDDPKPTKAIRFSEHLIADKYAYEIGRAHV